MNEDAAPIMIDFASEKPLIPDANLATEGSEVSRILNAMPRQSGMALRIRVRSSSRFGTLFTVSRRETSSGLSECDPKPA
jgi:hypothetical protein